MVFEVEAGEEVGGLKSKLFFQMSRSLGSQEPELGPGLGLRWIKGIMFRVEINTGIEVNY